MPLSILHVITTLDPWSGGPCYAIRGLVQEQLAQAHQLALVATDMQAGVGGRPAEQFRDELQRDVLWTRTLFKLVRSFGRGRPWNHLGFAPSAKRAIMSTVEVCNPDVIHVHGVFGWITSAACRVARRLRIPYIVEPYGAYDPICLRANLSPLKYMYHFIWGHKEMHLSSGIRVASRREAEPFRRIGCLRRKLFAIPYGVECDAGGSDPPGRTGRRFACYISRIAKKKRPEWAVYACEEVRRLFPALELVIAGSDDGHLPVLNKIVSQSGRSKWVHVRGFVAGPEKRDLLRSASLLVLPSIDESLGAVVLEAMAHSVPVVVTPGVAAGEHVLAAGAGVVADDSVPGVARAIINVLSSEPHELGRRGRQYVEQHLAWPRIAEKVEQMYRQAIDSSRCR